MARYWSGEIGGIPLEDVGGDVAGFELTGAGAFASGWTGNTRPGILGNPHTQYSEIRNGRVIELKFLHIPQTLAQALLDAITPIIPSGTGLFCSFTDGFQTIARSFKADVPNWYERGLPDGNYIVDFILRLKETGE